MSPLAIFLIVIGVVILAGGFFFGLAAGLAAGGALRESEFEAVHGGRE